MAGEKTTTQVEAKFLGLGNAGPHVTGYEIHMGRTEPVGEGQPVCRIERRLHETVGYSRRLGHYGLSDLGQLHSWLV